VPLSNRQLKSGDRPLPGHLSFEGSNTGDDRVREPSGRRARVDPISGREEVDPPRSELIQSENEMSNGASESVEPPNRNDVELATMDVVHE